MRGGEKLGEKAISNIWWTDYFSGRKERSDSFKKVQPQCGQPSVNLRAY